jgi:type I restriction enzyme M protein
MTTGARAEPNGRGFSVNRKGNKLWSPLRQRWLDATPEELVRQEYLCVLTEEYGFVPSQIAEELDVTGRGTARARADFVIWRTAQDKYDNANPLIVVECKADNVTIRERDYFQGESYARLTGARFFVTHNSRETRYWRVVHSKMPKTLEEIANIPHAAANDQEIEELLRKLKVFREEEFARLLHDCHNVIRNREKKDPAAAFDEIAKILFVKVWVERELRAKRRRENVFTTAFLDTQLGSHPLDDLFQKTKAAYRTDDIFRPDDHINLKPATGRMIVQKLERYNLSDTSEDVKGIAFERFLGRTFRGEIGQFFTPRPIVELMVQMVNPRENEVICDPASGSGGFLIRVFELVREKILADIDREYAVFKDSMQLKNLAPAKRAELLTAKFEALQASVHPGTRGSRLWRLANRCIYGTDANDRMARTSKMNMIMHGDGHGGVHHHDGFLNVNGIFEGRFDIVLTNPPFGSNVEPSDVVRDEDVESSGEKEQQYLDEYGDLYRDAQARVRAARGAPIASLFELPRTSSSKVKTEVLFLERCLALLKPGGRMGIVLPEGILNNPSLAFVRNFCEERAYLRAVVSLPPDTFVSSGATVKASLVFLQKFTTEEQSRFLMVKAEAHDETRAAHASDIAKQSATFDQKIQEARRLADQKMEKALIDESRAWEKEIERTIRSEARALLRKRFSYPVFLYEASKVGITATGERDENELYPNDLVPRTIERTCLELFRDFSKNPQAFVRRPSV